AAKGATAYVTLEPCCHHGRTGPCSEALIKAGVARVVYASDDPNPLVAGKGRQRLAEAGISVEAGLMPEDARALNPGYFSRHERGRVFLRSKIAVSLDGRTALANGESKWITGEAARSEVQHLRARSSAVLTGIGTVLADDPRLDVRLSEPGGGFIQPVRVILDSDLKTPAGARVFDQGGAVHMISAKAAAAGKFQAVHHCVPSAQVGVDLQAVMRVLYELGCNEVLVEAGPTLNGSLLLAGLVDELVVYMAPHLLGEGGRALANVGIFEEMAQRIELSITGVSKVGDDLRLTLEPGKKAGS
ncbi:MAG: bifunctional diaminohydroxyphosphoribosylaminopyrimidine deaminase/5-amino-6-(5-phosphoribosylamino)uracil reductase RibD, partial [Gammaproteobacteria bacterium]|nr:bifunctional diaminohydroxyphosphoribosylaminopyrimidine deaminase/5-amino-6-(5-phosphoribosylamino)uracil reductase RibD [Gammaproteobacteria bacterium]